MNMYLYDARYNLNTVTDYNKLSKMFNMKKNTLMYYKSNSTIYYRLLLIKNL